MSNVVIKNKITINRDQFLGGISKINAHDNNIRE